MFRRHHVSGSVDSTGRTHAADAVDAATAAARAATATTHAGNGAAAAAGSAAAGRSARDGATAAAGSAAAGGTAWDGAAAAVGSAAAGGTARDGAAAGARCLSVTVPVGVVSVGIASDVGLVVSVVIVVSVVSVVFGSLLSLLPQPTARKSAAVPLKSASAVLASDLIRPRSHCQARPIPGMCTGETKVQASSRAR